MLHFLPVLFILKENNSVIPFAISISVSFGLINPKVHKRTQYKSLPWRFFSYFVTSCSFRAEITRTWGNPYSIPPTAGTIFLFCCYSHPCHDTKRNQKIYFRFLHIICLFRLVYSASMIFTPSSVPTIIRLHIFRNCPVSSTPTTLFTF